MLLIITVIGYSAVSLWWYSECFGFKKEKTLKKFLEYTAWSICWFPTLIVGIGSLFLIFYVLDERIPDFVDP